MTFSSVKMGSGGFVTGLVAADGGFFARTDNGGAYELINGVWSLVFPGNIESINKATDGTLYVAEGANRVKDGVTVNSNLWKIVGGSKQSVLQVPMGANEYYRWVGERIQIDPLNDNVVYFASRQNGLQLSVDAGASWAQVSGIPVGTADYNGVAGVTFVACSGDGIQIGNQTRSSVLYVGVAHKGVYASSDGGQNWTQILNQDTVPQSGVLTGGLLYVSFFKASGSASIAAYNVSTQSWTTIYTTGNHSALTVLPDGRLLSIPYTMSPSELLVITGTTYTKVSNPSVISTNKPGWWPGWFFWGLAGALRVFGDYVYLSTGIGVVKSSASGNFTQWEAVANGIEQLVAFDVTVPPGGKAVTATADFNGFYQASDTAYPSQSHVPQTFSTNTSVAYSFGNPLRMVTVSASHHEPWKKYSGFSTNGGQTWQKFGSIVNNTHPSELNFGNIAVSCSDPNNIVWLPTDGIAPYYSSNNGLTWTKVTSPFDNQGGGSHSHLWNTQQALCADTVLGGTFYLYHYKGMGSNSGRLFRSTDGGQTWTFFNNLPEWAWQGASLKTVPGRSGHVWACLTWAGLWASSDQGATFTQITAVQEATAITFGSGATPPVYLIGKANWDTATGLYYSLDSGLSWTLYQALPPEMLKVTCMSADLNVPGKVYIGTNGNSYFTAQLSI